MKKNQDSHSPFKIIKKNIEGIGEFNLDELFDFCLTYLKNHHYYKTKRIARDFYSIHFNHISQPNSRYIILGKLKHTIKDITRKLLKASFIVPYGSFTYKIIKEKIQGDFLELKKKIRENNTIKCHYCGKFFDVLGINTHLNYCKQRNAIM